MYKIYVAGSYSSDNVIQVFKNMRNGINTGKDLLIKGYIPFVPWLDYQLFLQLGEDEEISLAQIQAYSMEWLGACDAVFVLPNSENSNGTQAEIKRAITLEIPVFTEVSAMDSYFESLAKSTVLEDMAKAKREVGKFCLDDAVDKTYKGWRVK